MSDDYGYFGKGITGYATTTKPSSVAPAMVVAVAQAVVAFRY